MSLTKALITEIQHESVSTKKMLERVPAEKFDWRPHAKSMTLKQLATHIANLSGWVSLIIKTDYLDFLEGTLKRPEINTTEDLVKENQSGTEQTIEALQSAKDEDLLNQNWTLRKGEHVIMEMTKAAFIRSMALNHLYHHRAQLSVYLRLLDIPIPGMYGPSADEMPKS
ncbi:MAG: DinB family protein [Chitinophagales bacterium]|nr:DinB family protein [Chitinophagales bacterium]